MRQHNGCGGLGTWGALVAFQPVSLQADREVHTADPAAQLRARRQLYMEAQEARGVTADEVAATRDGIQQQPEQQ